MSITDIAVERKFAALAFLPRHRQITPDDMPGVASLIRRAAPCYWSPRAIARADTFSNEYPPDAIVQRRDLIAPVQWWYLDNPNGRRTLEASDNGSIIEAILLDAASEDDVMSIALFESFRTPTHIIPAPVLTWTSQVSLTGPWFPSFVICEVNHQRPRREEENRIFGTVLFVLSAILWMRSKVARVERAALARHTRKRLGPTVSADDAAPRVITLRESESSTGAGGESRDVHYTCRWAVQQHIRLLPDHRATVVSAHIKGPKDKPFRARETRYKIDR